jgi:AcrR family transcriptional regulator
MAIKPTNRELKSRETHDKIVEAAQGLFTQYGYQTVSVKDIAAQAGMTTGALYHHFKNKEDLISAVFDLHDLGFEKMLKSRKEEADPIEGIISFRCDTMTKRIEDDGMEFTRQRVLHLFHYDKTSGFDRSLRVLIRHAMESNRFHEGLTEEELFDCLSSVHRGAVYQYCVSAEPVDLRKITEHRLRLTLQGLAKPE